jgi:hypothetical protein
MKTHRQTKPLSLPSTRWLAYATAGAASAVTCANSAEAEIHYSGNVSVELTLNAETHLPLSNGASLAFLNSFRSTFFQNFHFQMKGVNSGSARVYIHTGSFGRNFVSALPLRENVSAGDFYSVTGNPSFGVLIHFWSDGAWGLGTGGRGFVGFRFNTGNGTQYGWARVYATNGAKNRIHDRIVDYAWGDPGDRIRTGQTSSDENTARVVTKSGSLGLLALGSAGLEDWRNTRRQAPATH